MRVIEQLQTHLMFSLWHSLCCINMLKWYALILANVSVYYSTGHSQIKQTKVVKHRYQKYERKGKKLISNISIRRDKIEKNLNMPFTTQHTKLI